MTQLLQNTRGGSAAHFRLSTIVVAVAGTLASALQPAAALHAPHDASRLRAKVATRAVRCELRRSRVCSRTLFASRSVLASALNATGQIPGHSIAALRALKSSLSATAGGKGLETRPQKHDALLTTGMAARTAAGQSRAHVAAGAASRMLVVLSWCRPATRRLRISAWAGHMQQKTAYFGIQRRFQLQCDLHYPPLHCALALPAPACHWHSQIMECCTA